MAKTNKYVHFNTRATFNTYVPNPSVAEGNPYYYYTVFIKETKEIYTHGQFYDCSEYDDSDIRDLITNLQNDLKTKQDLLVSGTNIKTVNNNSLLGSGNISIATPDHYKNSVTHSGSGFVESVSTNDNGHVTAVTRRSLTTSDIPSLDASKITSGTISIDRLPAGALERLYIVETESAALSSGATEGDVVQVTGNSNKMYFCISNTATTFATKFREFTAGTATSVPWSGVTGKPTTLSGYGITDAYTSAQVDNKLAGYLPLSGGTLTGALTIGTRVIYGGDSANLLWYDGNHLQIGYNLGEQGKSLFLEATNVYLRYGSTRQTGLHLSPSGHIAIGGQATAYKFYVYGDAGFVNDVTAPTFIGALQGNADSATVSNTLAYYNAPSTDDFAAYIEHCGTTGLSVVVNRSGQSIGEIGEIYSALNIGAGASRFGRFLFSRNEQSNLLFWQSANDGGTGWGAKQQVAFTTSTVAASLYASNAARFNGQTADYYATTSHTHTVTATGSIGNTTSGGSVSSTFSGSAVNTGGASSIGTVYSITNVGTMTTATYGEGVLLITFGTVPTRESKTVALEHTHSVTATGTVSSTFTGAEHTHTFSGTSATTGSSI